jgi:hypothetical protein
MRSFIEPAASVDQRSGVSVLSLLGVVPLLGRHVAVWVRTCVDYHAAAAMYEQLSGLSDAELQRRGLSRANLGRDACAACDHAHRSS